MDINILSRIPQLLYKRTNAYDHSSDRDSAKSLWSNHQHLTDQKLQEEGKNEQTKNEAIKKEEDKQTLNDLVKKSNRPIISISSLFPWDFFANTITVEESRVTFVFRQFMSSQSYSVDIKDISNVFIQSSPFFATLQIVSRTFVQNDIKIGHLSTSRATKVHMVIEGLRTFAAHNIDTSNYMVGELVSKIEEIHKNKTV